MWAGGGSARFSSRPISSSRDRRWKEACHARYLPDRCVRTALSARVLWIDLRVYDRVIQAVARADSDAP
jgi:hypothetical protein